jgi:hypothetical protein
MNKDEMTLGDLCKFYEFQETKSLFFEEIPVYARLDGIGFSKFKYSSRWLFANAFIY